MHDLQWTPGSHGKGYVDQDYMVHTWNTNGPYGEPHHAEKATGDMSDTAWVQREYCAFVIEPDGKIDISMLANPKDPRFDEILKADPRLHRDSFWEFHASNSATANWTIGGHGKGYMLNDGTLHTWNIEPDFQYDDPFGDGAPGHYQHFMDNLAKWNMVEGPNGPEKALNLGDLNAQYDALIKHAFWIAPDGTVRHSGAGKVPDLEAALKAHHPDAKMDYEGWQFDDDGEEYIDFEDPPYMQEEARQQGRLGSSAFATELVLWLDSLNPKHQGPTPHHDTPEQMQTGFMSRVKRALKRKPKEEEPEVPEDEWEQMKEDWAENDDGWGWPTRYPSQPEPFREWTSATELPTIAWYGIRHELEQPPDHSFIYHVPTNSLHIGSPELHHHQLFEQSQIPKDEALVGAWMEGEPEPEIYENPIFPEVTRPDKQYAAKLRDDIHEALDPTWKRPSWGEFSS